MGLDIVLGWPGQTREERASLMVGPVDNKIGHLRCAYDEGDFNKWASANLGGRDLYWIFDFAEDRLKNIEGAVEPERGLFPDWDACAKRALEALDLAKEVADNLFLVPLPMPRKDPASLPTEGDLLNVYRKDRKDLGELWSNFTGNSPPLKSANGRFAADWVKIQGVLWSQRLTYKPHSPPIVEMQPVLVCEGPPGVHQGKIGLLNATLNLIGFGKEKGGWLHWSG